MENLSYTWEKKKKPHVCFEADIVRGLVVWGWLGIQLWFKDLLTSTSEFAYLRAMETVLLFVHTHTIYIKLLPILQKKQRYVVLLSKSVTFNGLKKKKKTTGRFNLY